MTTTAAVLDLVVRARVAASDCVDVFELAAADGTPQPPWAPGAHIDVLLADGVERQYSLCGNPGTPGVWRIGVLREDEGRGGSRWIHERLHPGSSVSVRGPWNHFDLIDAPRYRFVAGGIGITPLLPMIAAVHAAGRPWILDYAGRSLASMGFLAELERYGDLVRLHPSTGDTRVNLGAITPQLGELVYACGPQRMVDELERVSAEWEPGTLHVERFEARDVGAPVLHETFEVELTLTGVTVEVAPDDSILDAVEAAGAFVLSSCREGTCGTCETVVLDGAVDHRDSILSPQERAANDRMMICVSRAACPRLVLEL